MLSSKTDRGSDATAETGSSPARGTATGPVAALFDAVAITVFVLIGRASHEEGYALTSVLHTLWPFLAGCAAGWSITYVYAHVRSSDFFGHDFRPDRVVPVGLVIWFCTVTVAMILRFILSQGVAVSFVIVAAVVLALFLLGWRAVFAYLGRRAAA
ncbi:DUF3054 family protein [Gordonia sp. JH63]|uniref:DUF3054 domain-containing protein n=2 Tax=Gordoniaceae TaxID=85026 RepID=UPI00071D347C|nr:MULTISPECIES: DUF3054 domain-containing protein [Gordonia]OCW86326.1 hypothetical protein A8M60_21650 [Nocardia farcinica]KSU57488.1 hypothetical protein AS181_14370 [Gordonia sp. SGD-V-85]MBR7193180.1 DUF3054 domain-containing protein [Gordonia sp. SCSIO 19800]MCT1353064.1 DUF3054 domain-containing protein [Gordonia sp. p3-SID1431]MDT0221459.1 DUF3054 domain-containing protein [Gordonia sp. AC31]